MARDYAVTVTASRTAVEPAILAARLADLLGEPLEEVETALRAGAVILQGDLSYGEALQMQRELAKRQIPCTIASSKAELEGATDYSRSPVQQEEEIEEEPPASESEDIREVVESPAQERVAATSGAWGALFPDLEESEEEESDGFFEELRAAEEEARGAKPTAVPVPVARKATSAPAPAPESSREKERLQEAFDLRDREVDRPPFQPRGYDPRPPHVSLVAALLSGLAPGAGQVFNGQAEKARGYSWKFVVLLPWVESVRDAWKVGEKIRSYYAPRPEPAAAKEALFYVGKWWATVLVIVFSVTWIVGAAQEYQADRQEMHERRAFRELLYYGEDAVADALEEAREAAEVERQERMERARVERQDRARRLFIVGYHQCLQGEYELCAAAMRRVSTLQRENPDALRLQTWASVKAQAADSELPMPNVGVVPTLEEFEWELAREGESLDEFTEREGMP